MTKNSIKKNNKCNKKTFKIKKGGEKSKKDQEIPGNYKPVHQQIEDKKEKKPNIKVNEKDKDIQQLINRRNSSEKKLDVNIKHKENVVNHCNIEEIKLLIENKFMDLDKKNSLQIQEIKD